MDKLADYLVKFPELLVKYSAYSFPLLGLLLLTGLIIVGAHFLKKKRSNEGLSATLVLFGSALILLSCSGFVLKIYGERAEQKARQQQEAAFISQYRAPGDQYRLLVFDFSLPDGLTAEEQTRYRNKMKPLEDAISIGLLESLPAPFRKQPRVTRVPANKSPWKGGVGQTNFEMVQNKLNAFEIIWGHMLPGGDKANAYLGVKKQIAGSLDTLIPIPDINLSNDPSLNLQFGDGRYRLLGLITLGMALDTYRQGAGATGEQRRLLFITAVEQINAVRSAAVSLKDDPILKRTLYGPDVDAMLQNARKEGGLD